ncbi:MAG: hypothetical protein SO119_09680 [Phascolarctobacterium sp.]|nr:hypothetical protein [Phascolarctobacterium sp.]
MEAKQDERQREQERRYTGGDLYHRVKPPWYVQVILAFYGFLWLNMIFITGLNSLRLGYIDYDSGSIFLAMTLGLKLIFWYMDKYYGGE